MHRFDRKWGKSELIMEGVEEEFRYFQIFRYSFFLTFMGNVINENTAVFINLLYLLHLSLGNWLSLKAGVGSALSGVSSGPLSALVCGVREAVEEGHLLSQA